MDIHRPNVITDGGPWAEHDQACAVCSERGAVLNLNLGVYEPCGECQARGWRLDRRKRPRNQKAYWRFMRRAEEA